MMKFYYTYILSCADGTYYTGVTSDLDQRIMEHQSGKHKGYTYNRRPVKLKWYARCVTPEEAIKLEKQIKGWSRKKKTALIEENWKDLVEYSKNYTEFGHPDKRDG